jgi:predicted RNA-binding Zn-ribbon protein involved in translation (DUF1610 family)
MFAVAGIAVEEVDEVGTSPTCPHCGSDDIVRYDNTIHCVACRVA